VEPGWGSYEGPRLKLLLEERNFLGTARRATLSGHLSAKANGTRIAFFEPKIFGGKTNASASIFRKRREEPSFTFDNLGFNIVLRRPLGRYWSTSLAYDFRFNELSQVDVAIIDPDDVAEPNVGLLAFNLAFNDRDDLVLPTRGTRGRVQWELAQQALGSEIDFLRTRLEWSRLYELDARDGLAFNARAVLTHILDDSASLPLHERAFLGGENSVRSFDQSELGPRDASGQPLGGEASTLFSIEWRRQLSGNFSGALFADAGNVVGQVEDYLGFDDFRFGLGAGIRYALPIGPLRIDLGLNPATRDQEDEYVLHFSVGYPF